MKKVGRKSKGFQKLLIWSGVSVVALGMVLSNGMSVSAAPVDSSFDDDNFYTCVLDAYNSTNGTSKTRLTNAELATIETLSCDNYFGGTSKSIVSVKGIEKLVGLTDLSLSQNRITSIDLSKNVRLKNLVLFDTTLKKVDLSKNVLIEKVVIDGRLGADDPLEIHLNKDSDFDRVINALKKEVVATAEDSRNHINDMFNINSVEIRDFFENVVTGSVNNYVRSHDTEFIQFYMNVKFVGGANADYTYYLFVDDNKNSDNGSNGESSVGGNTSDNNSGNSSNDSNSNNIENNNSNNDEQSSDGSEATGVDADAGISNNNEDSVNNIGSSNDNVKNPKTSVFTGISVFSFSLMFVLILVLFKNKKKKFDNV